MKTSYASDYNNISNAFACKLCNTRFESKVSFLEHMEQHYICDVCGEPFLNYQEVEEHIVNKHYSGKNSISTECSEEFSSVISPEKHMLVHGNEHPFPSSDCKKLANELGQHVVVPTSSRDGKQVFNCPVCDRAFKVRKRLQQHLRIHTGERPFKCWLCSRAFIQKTNLMKHMRIHTGERPFGCLVCNKKFMWPSDLKKHMRTHGEVNFAGTVGHKTFGQKSALK